MIELGALPKIRDRDSRRFRTNFLQNVVCELRFPTILEWEKEPPYKVQKALKKDYPLYAERKGINVSLEDSSVKKSDASYVLNDRKKHWTITIRPSRFSLETQDYTDYKEFRSRLEQILNHIQGVLDTNFYTRVGLRYINAIPVNDNDLDGWINDELVEPFKVGRFGDLFKLNTEMSGFSRCGKYTMRHGIGEKKEENGPFDRYFIDFDHYSENVEHDELFDVLDCFHEFNFSFFFWSLGPKAIAALEPQEE